MGSTNFVRTQPYKEATLSCTGLQTLKRHLGDNRVVIVVDVESLLVVKVVEGVVAEIVVEVHCMAETLVASLSFLTHPALRVDLVPDGDKAIALLPVDVATLLS
ncbi:unnamed protein product [Phytophthora lilii]|uniref:Unnamed protein product n=1 Tax=Phytophthora lilii TaxID=2077276 RepID=A0A9W6TEQ4_9STRA|nr:unnamed protein product [Phytophthora lilii]